MPIDLEREELYSLADIVQFIPRSVQTRKKIHRSAPLRWARVGLKAGDGRVFLEVVKAGGCLATSKEAIHRFFDELTRRASLPNGSAASPGKDDLATGDRAKSSDIQRRLDEAGF